MFDPNWHSKIPWCPPRPSFTLVETNHVTTKLDQAIGILSTLRNNTSLKTLMMTYHSLFSSHLRYGSQLWEHTNLTNQNKI